MHSCTLVCENTILDGLGEALQAIHAGDEDVLYAAIEGLASAAGSTCSKGGRDMPMVRPDILLTKPGRRRTCS